jgi:hypothetical protein
VDQSTHRLWQEGNGTPGPVSPFGQDVTSFVLGSDAKYVFWVDQSTHTLWDEGFGHAAQVSQQGQDVTSFALSPDGESVDYRNNKDGTFWEEAYGHYRLLGPAALDLSQGFANARGLMTLNSSAAVNGAALELTDGGPSRAGSAFSTHPVDVTHFTTQFTFQLTPGANTADGFTFTIQGVGNTVLGPSGGGLGYGSDHTGGTGGIANSVAVKFDLYNNQGEGEDSTGLYINGAAPTDADSIDLSGTGIDLHSGDTFNVSLSYDGTTLMVTETDTNTGSSASQSYAIYIPGTVGGGTANVGFTAGTGGLTAVQSILTWTYTPTTSAIGPAMPRVSVRDGGTYKGTAFLGSGSALGADGVTPVAGSWAYVYYAGSTATGAPLPGAPTDAGTYTVVGSFTSSDPNYANASAQATFTIIPASPTVSVSDQNGTHSGSAVGVDGATAVAGTWAYAYYAGSTATGTPLPGAPTAPGTYTVVASFSSSDPNYTNGSAQANFTINQTLPTVSVRASGGTYTGTPFVASGSAVGSDGRTPVAGSWTYTYYPGSTATGTPLPGAPTAAGTYTMVAAFTSSDPNYGNGSAQATFTIRPAAPAVSINAPGGTANGSPFPASASATGVGGTAMSGSFLYTYYSGSSASGTGSSTPPSAPGTYTVVAAFTSSDPNYTNTSAAQTFTITPVERVVHTSAAEGPAVAALTQGFQNAAAYYQSHGASQYALAAYVDSYNAWAWANYAAATHSALAWQYACIYAQLAYTNISQDYGWTVDGNAVNAYLWEVQGFLYGLQAYADTLPNG